MVKITDTQTNVGEAKMTKFRWVVMSVIFMVFTVAAADRANIGMALPFIRKEFAMSNTEAGALASLFLLPYALCQLPAGFIYSKLGVRKVFPLAMVATSIVTGLIGTSSSIFMLKAYRFLLGFAEGPLPAGITSTINHWFPPKEKGIATGIFTSAAKLGPVLVPPLCAWILIAYGWREIFYICATPGIILSILWYVLVKNRPSESPYCSEAERQYIESETTPTIVADQMAAPAKQYNLVWLDKLVRATKIEPLATKAEVLRSRDVWGCALGYFFMLGIMNCLLAWIPTYLVKVKMFSIANTGIVAAAPWAGAILGNLIGGWFSDRVVNKRRKPTMMFSAFTLTFIMYSLVYAPNDPNALAALMFVLGVFMNIGFSTYAVYTMGLTTKQMYPIAFSVVNMAGNLGGASTPLITGILLDYYSWDAVWLFLSICCLLCLAVLFTIREPVEDPLITNKDKNLLGGAKCVLTNSKN